MPNLTPSELRDPQPPLPGERERALVSERAHQLDRRRHLAQGGGALALVAVVAVSVAALTAGGSSRAGGTNRIETASGSNTTVSTPVSHVTTAPTTVAPTVTVPTPAPEVTPDTTSAVQETQIVAPQDVAPVEPAAPGTFMLSGTVTGNPAGTTVSLTFTGPDGTINIDADGAGNFSASGLVPGDYAVIGQWTDSTSSATGAQRFGTVSVNGDATTSFTFSN